MRHVSSRFPVTKILINDSDGFVRVEITGHTNSHVIGYIPFVEVVFDIHYRGVLQVFLCTNSGLGAIGMGRRQFLTQRTHHLIVIIREIDVILLIYRLQLSMETTDHHILETIALNLCPILNFVRRYILGITGHIIGGEGVGALSADGSHQLVIFIGDKVLGSHLTHGIDLMIGLFTLVRVCKQTIALIACLDVVQQRSLCFRIGRTEVGGTFKHQVLQIVGQTSSFCRIVFRARPYSDKGLETRFLIVHGEINLQTII